MKKIRFLITVCMVVVALLSPRRLTAENCATLLSKLSKAQSDSDKAAAAAELVKLGDNPQCFAETVVQSSSTEQSAFNAFIKYLEVHRTDKQAGSNSGTGGGTSLVSKGVTAQILSFAAEYGAITESVNKQIVTIQGTLDGIPTALVRNQLIPYCPSNEATQPACLHEGLLRFLRRISYGVSFNTAQNVQTVNGTPAGTQQGSSQPISFSAQGSQLSSITGRFVLWPSRDATSSDFQKRWKESLTGGGQNSTPALLLNASANLMSALSSLIPDPENEVYSDWQNRAARALTEARTEDQSETWNQCANQLIELLQGKDTAARCGAPPRDVDPRKKPKFVDPSLVDHATNFLQTLSLYRFEEEQFVTSIAEKPVLTFEFDNNRDPNQPSRSTFRMIFDKGLSKNWSLTANGAIEIYDATPSNTIPGASRVRDSQFGIEIDRSLGNLSFLGAAVLSGAYYFQYQNSPSILNVIPAEPLTGITFTGLPNSATQVFTQKGNLHIGQIRLVLGTGAANVRFPIAFSYSNRTELITKPTWKAQIGITYDIDSLFSK